jgi:hypothetical protein
MAGTQKKVFSKREKDRTMIPTDDLFDISCLIYPLELFGAYNTLNFTVYPTNPLATFSSSNIHVQTK